MKQLLLLALAAGMLGAADTEKTLMAADEQFCRDFAARGVDGWMSWFAEEPVVFPPDGPVIRTKAEAYAFYRKMFATPGMQLTWKPLGGMISSSRDLGFTWGSWESRGTDAQGKAVRRTGKYQTTWKKQADGSWKIVADIGNPDAPPKP